MPVATRTVPEIASPPLPARLVDAYDASGLLLRRFGAGVEDLAVDFQQPPPYAVTDVLVCCARRPDGGRVDPSLFWELSVGARILYLVLLAGMEQTGAFALQLRCPQPACRQAIEIDVSVDEVLDKARSDADEPVDADVDGTLFRLRRPTGADQAAWLDEPFHDEAGARAAILQSLLVDAPPVALPPDWQRVAEAALDAADPLVRFNVSIVCPDCEAESALDVPLAAVALESVRRAQTRLMESVHVLASRYGWSETEGMRIPPWRRGGYLGLVEREQRL